jgi:hypothetical protein
MSRRADGAGEGGGADGPDGDQGPENCQVEVLEDFRRSRSLKTNVSILSAAGRYSVLVI